MTGVLAYDPLRLATLASNTQAAADELAAVAGEEPFVVDAVGVCHGIAAGLDETLLTALRAVLSSTAMTEWNGAALLTVDALIDALTGQARRRPVGSVRARSRRVLPRRGDHPSRTGPMVPRRQPGVRARTAGGSYIGGGYVTDHRGVRWPIVVCQGGDR